VRIRDGVGDGTEAGTKDQRNVGSRAGRVLPYGAGSGACGFGADLVHAERARTVR
jgi:hypothetical protein